nr:hypothetical protein HAGR004_41330 [Bdellovibrio sp. HAGR004]
MADLQQNNHKKRDPAYYRAYRKRKKAETADNLLAFPSFNKKLKPALNKKPLKGQTWFFVLGIVFTLAITLTLIHLCPIPRSLTGFKGGKSHVSGPALGEVNPT